MIRVSKTASGRTAPVILCAHCEMPIDDAGLALAMWKKQRDVLLEDGKVYFSHKACHEKIEGGEPTLWASSELRDFLRRLVHNVQADISEDIGTEFLDNLP